jgi:hypothetical protein
LSLATMMTTEHARTLASILDAIIPPRADGALPGAGTLGLDAHIAQAVERAPELDFVVAPGVAAADALASERHGRRFAELAPDEKLEVLHALDGTHPAFVGTLVFHAYIAYYQHPRVREALGLEARPPHPSGYAMAPNDLTLLDVVRRRSKLYRDA